MLKNSRVIGNQEEKVMVGYRDKDRKEIYKLEEIECDVNIVGKNEESKKEVLRGLIYLLSKRGLVEVLDEEGGYYDVYEGYENIQIRRMEEEVGGYGYVILPKGARLEKEIEGVKIGIEIGEGEEWRYDYKEVGKGEIRGEKVYHYNKTRWEIMQKKIINKSIDRKRQI